MNKLITSIKSTRMHYNILVDARICPSKVGNMTDGEMSRLRTVLATVLLRLSVISKSLVNTPPAPRMRQIG